MDLGLIRKYTVERDTLSNCVSLDRRITALGAEAFAACMPAGRACTALDGAESVVDWPWSIWLEVEGAGAGDRRDMVFELVV